MDHKLSKSIFVIVKLNAKKQLQRFIGSGFCVNPGQLCVTAKHVFDDCPLEDGESYCILFESEGFEKGGIGRAHPIKRIYWSDFDLAIFKADIKYECVYLELNEKDQMPANMDIFAVEYNDSTVKTDEQGELFVFDAYFHKGNVSKYYIADNIPNQPPTACFNTSFPALKGASGTPVILNNGLKILGMLIGNTERHLMPAHIEKIQDGVEPTVVRMYYLPYGTAIRVSVIKDFLNKILEQEK